MPKPGIEPGGLQSFSLTLSQLSYFGNALHMENEREHCDPSPDQNSQIISTLSVVDQMMTKNSYIKAKCTYRKDTGLINAAENHYVIYCIEQ